MRLNAVSALLALLAAAPSLAQGLTAPPSGNNQRSTVSQQIGAVTVTVEYSSPRVTLNGQNRRGKIYNTPVVPYGLTNLGFGTCKECPWRAGANESTTFTATHAVKVQGKALPAGRYGLFMIPGENEWTVIFSKDSSAWGSFYYEIKDDQLRVKTKAAKSDYHEWLTFEFTEREPAKATVALRWEDLQVPLTITVDDPNALYVEQMRKELHTPIGFSSASYKQAADFALQNKIALPQALGWAQTAVNGTFIGQENFGTLLTLSRAQAANGQEAEGKKTEAKAFAHATAGPLDLHQAGRQLLAEGKKDEAMRVFQLNAERHPNQWPIQVGLMRGYAAMGEVKKALDAAKLAVGQAPDPQNKATLEAIIKKLEDGKGDIN